MKIQLDTNVLTRVAQTSPPIHPQAMLAVQSLTFQSHELCIVPQNLFEFWAVATRPLGDNGLGLAVREAKVEFDRIKRMFTLLSDVPELLDEWEVLVVQRDCKGKPSYDARIVAAMKTHGVSQLLTLNGRDFIRYPEITLLDPIAIASKLK